ncbi:MBL fold metallo-hydrolase [Clostridium sp. CX1]|uniref:MBL fold metallo-hydrolase n=1 Tax=Clostridium sp. CX1 TaxID=2978346 RepID=UPI0021BFC2E1|nr:MBL fold metallo-hydrolase [Clostridium sp. CX1]MCT8975308.1 MBL fold metallo-hydrolase [Clostridium sp. CX1]
MEYIVVLNVSFDFGYGEDTIYPVILKDKNEMILIDCGYPEFLPKLEQSAKEKGIDFSELTKVIITHHDHDHMGSLAAIKRKYPRVQVIASEKNAPYIEGKARSLRLQQAEQTQLLLPPEQQEAGRVFQDILKAVENVEVDFTVKDGDYFPWCGGIEIVETPGHMPGHISLYINKCKVLISGDALAIENGKLEIAAPQFTLDMPEAKKSVLKLLNYDIEKIICYHGGEYKENISEALQNI